MMASDVPAPEVDSSVRVELAAVPPMISGSVIEVVKVGAVANTAKPVPVSSVIAAARLADDGVARNVATPVPNPLTPVLIGRPVALVRTAAEGVPSAGVVKLGEVVIA